MKRMFMAVALSVFAAGCGLNGIIYSDYTVSRNWISEQRADTTAAPDAHGEACAKSYLSLIATGDSGFDAAYKAALAASGATSLWDVRVDTKFTTIVGIVSTLCTEVTGKVAK